MIFDIVAPLSAPQIAASKPPPPPMPPKPDWFDQRILDLVREFEPLKLWQALNLLAEDMSPRNRDEGREARLRLLRRVERLIRLGLLFRGRRNQVATFEFMSKPAIRRARRRKPSVGKTISTKAVSELIRPPLPKKECRPLPVSAEVVGASHGSQNLSSSEEITKTAPVSEDVSTAASALAKLPRRPKIWSGWIGSTRAYRRMPIRLSSGEPVFAYGALRGHVAYTREPDGRVGDPELAGQSWGVVRVNEVEVVKNEAARLLGTMKAGTVERKSEAKARAARLNGTRPCRGGKFRGRPRTSSK